METGSIPKQLRWWHSITLPNEDLVSTLLPHINVTRPGMHGCEPRFTRQEREINE
jgi:hypothetical protein